MTVKVSNPSVIFPPLVADIVFGATNSTTMQNCYITMLLVFGSTKDCVNTKIFCMLFLNLQGDGLETFET